MTQHDDNARKCSIADALNFYEANFEAAGQWILEAGSKVVLKRADGLHICRFCGRSDAEVTFETVAHALPEALGNKSLFSEYECDECNGQFGRTIESDFGTWSQPMRTMMRIKGKNGVPTMAKGSRDGWRIEYKESRLKVTARESDPIFQVDEANRQVTFTLRRDPHTPIAVLKTFWKMALTVMSEQDVAEYAHALAWLRAPHAPTGLAQIPVFRTFVPGPLPNDKIAIQLLRRKSDDIAVPYMYFILMYANEMFQVALPAVGRDAHLDGKTTTIPFYPTPYDLLDAWPFGQTQRGPLFLSGAEVVPVKTFPLTMSYDSIGDNETP
ncbi:HNH endonuclease [Burkholderia sp. Bmkn7]|uniref:HNH endonuclease n=1 Tax=Burkholderia sp. Bmkn7 TaxID=3236841 RepID=UPI0034E614D0